MKNLIKNIVSIFVLVAIILATALTIVSYTQRTYGAVNPAEATLSTSTPFLANNTVLCSNGGVLDGIYNGGLRTGQFWVINASSTTHTDFATTTALIAILDAGTGTTTSMISYGTEASRGLIVGYTGAGTTTITYRCGV